MLTTLVVAVLVLGALFLATPVDVVLRLQRRPVLRYRVAVRWLYGLIGTELAPRHGSRRSPAPETKPATAKKERRDKKGRGLHVAAMLRSRGFLPSVVRLVRRLLHVMRIREPTVWLRAGFGDPASTGVLCGLLLPLVAYLQTSHPTSVDVAPDFSQERFEFTFTGHVRIAPLHILWPMMVFGLSPGTLRGLIALRTGRGA